MNEDRTCSDGGTELTQRRSRLVREFQQEGFTYFIRAGESIKIGFATNFARRFASLKSGHDQQLEVLVVVPAAMADESETHQLFAHLRMRGEWFRADRELLNFIDGLKAGLRVRGAGVAELAPPPMSPSETVIHGLQSRMHTLPEAAKPFARNMIEQIKNGILTKPPMGDHPLQRPEVLVRRQLEGFERAMRDAQ